VKVFRDRSVTSPMLTPRWLARLDVLSSTSVRFITLEHLPAAKDDYAPEQILEQERAEVAEVRRLCRRFRTRRNVSANGFAILGRKRFDLAGEGVVERKYGRMF